MKKDINNLNILSINRLNKNQALDQIKEYFKTYFRASSFIYKSTLNKNIPIANTILFFNKNTRVFEGGGIIPISVYGNENYYYKNRLPKKAKLHKWVENSLKASNTYSNFFHLVLETGNYSKDNQLGAVENSIKVLNLAFTYFIRNFKNNFPVVNYVSTIETANNGLPHIHFLVQLEKPIEVSMTHNHKGDFLLPSYEVKSRINKLWINAIKIASEKLCIENKLPVKVFVSGVFDNHIIDYLTKQWIPINKLVLKDNTILTDTEKAAIFTHYFCKAYSIRQVRNSNVIDEIEIDSDSSKDADLILLFHNKYLNKNTHFFIKMFLTLDFYKTRGLTLEDFPVSIFKFSLKIPRKPLLRPPGVLKSLVNQYFHAFDLIIENGIKNDFWFKKIYTIEDLINISFDGDFYFILENE